MLEETSSSIKRGINSMYKFSLLDHASGGEGVGNPRDNSIEAVNCNESDTSIE